MTSRNRSSGPSAAPPQIFDMHLLTLRRARAARRAGTFFAKRCTADLADRLLDINRPFKKVAFWGLQLAADQLQIALPKDKRADILTCNANLVDIQPRSQDLVISLLQLQSDNDPVGTLIQMRNCLKPDGLLITAMFGGNSLTELRQAFYETDTQFHGGISPHISPFADHVQAAELLGRAGLALPVVDVDRFTVNYSRLSTLVSDLRDLGETNVLHAQSKTYLSPSYFEALSKVHEKSVSSDKLKTSFEILWLTGWSPDASQQKPSKRGSANMRLGDAINLMGKQP